MLLIDSLQLLGNTVTRKTEIKANYKISRGVIYKKCIWFSMLFDESNDILDTAKMVIMIKMVFSEFFE